MPRCIIKVLFNSFITYENPSQRWKNRSQYSGLRGGCSGLFGPYERSCWSVGYCRHGGSCRYARHGIHRLVSTILTFGY